MLFCKSSAQPVPSTNGKHNRNTKEIEIFIKFLVFHMFNPQKFFSAAVGELLQSLPPPGL